MVQLMLLVLLPLLLLERASGRGNNAQRLGLEAKGTGGRRISLRSIRKEPPSEPLLQPTPEGAGKSLTWRGTGALAAPPMFQESRHGEAASLHHITYTPSGRSPRRSPISSRWIASPTEVAH